MGLWSRILGRYLVGALIGLLAYAGLPADVIDLVRNDPEITLAVTVFVGGVIEWVTVQARKRGWLT
jgi:hypothetical protein